ncbi:MAG: mechanosensitive ion channel family protein [Chloroflexota bacterium]
MSALEASLANFWQADVVQKLPAVLVSLVESLAIIVALLYAGHRLQRSWREGRLSKTTNVNLGIVIGRLTYLGAIAVGAIWVGYIVDFHWSGLLTFVGAVSLAIAFSIQDILKNLVAGLYLLVERPFVIGDAIKVRDFSGTVEDVQIRVTLLRTDNGQAVIVPNSVLFGEVVVNRRGEVPEAPAAEAGPASIQPSGTAVQ